MRHLKHVAAVAASLALAGTAAWLVSPGARSFVDHHPADAVYIVMATGLVDALRHALSGGGVGGSA